MALAALITFAPLIFFANHSFRLENDTSTRQVVEMRLIEDLAKTNSFPNKFKQLVVPTVVQLPSPVVDADQSKKSENSITKTDLPIEAIQPKPLSLEISPKPRDSINKNSQSPVKQLIEEESIKASKRQNEKFANDVKNSAKPDCLKNDQGLGIFGVVPLIYDIVKEKCN